MTVSDLTENTVAPHSPFDIVALVASAGGLEALSTVLRPLPADFPAAVIVVQHLPASASQLVDILARRSALPVEWASHDVLIEPSKVTVCPPRQIFILHPDRTGALEPNEGGILEYPMDAFLRSLADSYGKRALVVVLTGMGHDGAAGAKAVKSAGGTVIAQSGETAEYASMPNAAIATGAVDLVVPLSEIASVLIRVVAQGGPFPKPRDEEEAVQKLFTGPGEMRALMRSIDWSTTRLGPVITWPPMLQMMVRALLATRFPMSIFWGENYIELYNDAYIPILSSKHPAVGQPLGETWPEIFHLFEAWFEEITRTGEAVYAEDQLLTTHRRGMIEDAYFTFSLSPIFDEQQQICGIFQTVTETTRRVLSERRLRTLRSLAESGTNARTLQEAGHQTMQIMAANPHDIAFGLFYLLDDAQMRLHLSATTGAEFEPYASPVVDLSRGHSDWPLAQVVQDNAPIVVDDLTKRFLGLSVSQWPEALTTAMVMPLKSPDEERPLGVLIIGLSPRRLLDAPYREFIQLIASQVTVNLVATRSAQRNRERIEALAALDHAKTEFFSNISHEFRTPLTLMLGPLENTLNRADSLPETLANDLEIVQRNAQRLLRLVNTLLDFSRIEEGRMKAHFEPTDLGTFTTDLASLFRSAAVHAGLTFIVDCPPLTEWVWVDRDMWEKIASNLLSNALKFTFNGTISISLHALPNHVELTVRDTGIGIPEAELPHLFKRFHRVPGTHGRTHEGSGIGLALVHELVTLHYGRIRVRSEVGVGTTFTIWIPTVARPRIPERDIVNPTMAVITDEGRLFAAEAERWMETNTSDDHEATLDDNIAPMRLMQPGACVLVVDDNADMRDYLRRLLSTQWEVELATNGAEALASAMRRTPDLILTDVMMPELDGFALLRHMRDDERLKALPIILLTARAGEETAIEGLMAGADDYIVKPFSARELMARVGAQLELARLRRENRAALEEREERLRLALHAADMAVWEIDVRTEMLKRSERYYEIFGYTSDEMGDTLSGLLQRIHPDDRDRIQKALKSTIQGEPLYRQEYRIVQRNGAIRHLSSLGRLYRDENGERSRLLGVIYDITDRKQAEVALRESEGRFRTLVQNIRDYAIFMIDAQGFITEWTEGAQRVKGYTPEEAVGQHISLFYTPEGLAAGELDQEMADAAAQGRAERESWRIRKGGERFWVNEIMTAIYDEAGQVAGFTKISRDLTERRRADLALRESEERLRLMIDSAKDFAIFTIDIEGNVTSWNVGAERMFLFREEEIVGRNGRIIYTPQDQVARIPEQEMKKAREVGYSEDERWHKRKDGGLFYGSGTVRPLYAEDGHLRGFTKVMRDRTEQKLAERALQDAKDHLRLIIDSAKDYTIYAMDAEGRVTSWNTGGEEMFGYTEAEILGQHERLIYTEEDQAQGIPEREMRKAREAGYAENERWHRHKDGHRVYGSGMVRPLCDEAGNLRGYTKVMRDGTQRKEQEELSGAD
jgi:PAS domain S-box-containing protein